MIRKVTEKDFPRIYELGKLLHENYENLYNLEELTKKEYFKILSPDFPEWLLDYIDAPEMQRLSNNAKKILEKYSKEKVQKEWSEFLENL